MTWNISASGNRQQCIEAVTAQKHHADTGGEIDPTVAPDVTQFEEARHSILDELEGYPESAPSISVSASGHAPAPGGGSRYLNVSVSGTA